MKKIVLALALILVGSFMLSGCSKDEILDHYNNIIQSAGAIELTGKLSLEGTKEKGIDDYTGTYTADYENFSDTEYLFGGTSIKREAGIIGSPQLLFLIAERLHDLAVNLRSLAGGLYAHHALAVLGSPEVIVELNGCFGDSFHCLVLSAGRKQRMDKT